MEKTLYKYISQVQSTNPYFSKDLKKAIEATKFIGRGSSRSSTHKYMLAAKELANCGKYSSEDIIFISAEGNRIGRLSPDFEEIKKAIEVNATFVTDNYYDRNRPYNIGEREVAEFLEKNEYKDNNGLWKKKI